jgi:hypothetical protein
MAAPIINIDDNKAKKQPVTVSRWKQRQTHLH